jgi:hypothetical protein
MQGALYSGMKSAKAAMLLVLVLAAIVNTAKVQRKIAKRHHG